MKKILITGSSSGIGRAIAESLLEQGFTVIGVARNHQKFKPATDNYIPVTIDLAESKNLENKYKNLLKQHPDIEACVANAGFGYIQELEQFSYAQMQEIMQVNFLSQALLAKLLVPVFKTQHKGKFIFMGSEDALSGAKKSTMYCASKFAMRGFAQSLRLECAHQGVTVSILNLGLVQTPFFDKLNYKPGEDVKNTIEIQSVVDTVNLVLQSASGNFDEINIRPLQNVVIKNGM